MPRKPTTIRGLMADVAGEEATLERMREIADRALNVDHLVTVECPHCRESFRAPLPNTGTELKNAIALLEQIEGKAGEQPPGALTIIVERPTS
jgi:hypothetical protein